MLTSLIANPHVQQVVNYYILDSLGRPKNTIIDISDVCWDVSWDFMQRYSNELSQLVNDNDDFKTTCDSIISFLVKMQYGGMINDLLQKACDIWFKRCCQKYLSECFWSIRGRKMDDSTRKQDKEDGHRLVEKYWEEIFPTLPYKPVDYKCDENAFMQQNNPHYLWSFFVKHQKTGAIE